MKKNFFVTLFAAMLFSFTNCSDDKDTAPVYTPPTQSELQNLYNKSLADIKIEKNFDAASGITFTSPKGVKFSFTGSLYNQKHEVVTGNVKLEYIEIFDRGSMVVTNKPLMGYDISGNLRPLITGGEFYVNFTQNGEQLSVYGYQLEIPGALTGGVDKNMILWDGTIDEDGNLTWKERRLEQKGEMFPDSETNQYKVYLNGFGWTNVDILSSEEGEKTPLLVEVPEGYNNKNACVYVAYKGKPGLLAYLDQYSPSKKLFTEHYGWAPIGFSLYVIFISEQNGKYLYSIKEVTVVKDAIITINSSDLAEGTKDEVAAKINALP